jgi:hypothetical protein
MLLKASRRRRFWLSTALVRSVDGGRVRLHVDRRVIRRYREPMLERSLVARSGLKPPAAMLGFLTTAAAAALWLAN